MSHPVPLRPHVWSRRRLLASLPVAAGVALAACGAAQTAQQAPSPLSTTTGSLQSSATSPATSATGTGTTAATAAVTSAAPTTATTVPASPATANGASVTIHMLERAGQEAQALDIRIPQFMQQNPTIKVIRDSTPGDIIQKEATLAAADTLPDTVHSYLGDESYQFFSANGILIPIEDRLARDKVDLTGWFPALIEVMRVDGKLHGLPFKGQVLTSAFYFNTDLFDQAGLAYPTENWTLDDLTSMAEKLTKR